jgi:5-methylcytosine-specific restriction endonuclease McrA
MEAARRPGHAVLSERTLVLNRGWVPIHVTTVRRALVMLFHEVAVAVRPETYETFDFHSWMKTSPANALRVVRTVRFSIPAPDVIVLSKYDRLPSINVPFSRKNLCRRDRLSCQYCGRRQGTDSLTIDHIVPKSRGGTTSWSNCVLACAPCNRKKGGRTPDEAGMNLLARPRRPDWSFVIRHESGAISDTILQQLGRGSNGHAEVNDLAVRA